ncbi:hypothetical protein [Cerasicoccus arenae]|uniref:Uncharacterized protein n=1 Tax=Cerasicoccus arenae TaxID=424488 RepID=A0A8J3GF23_9BACT|nr:hypothetical protein [Cerasicoccus arenae]MBK1857396.1 hypothetical protein [Cerasicoccus arenae]GHC07965.1 hypothetical protein GCM10007047_26530 [Cerasicoccus arenae]
MLRFAYRTIAVFCLTVSALSAQEQPAPYPEVSLFTPPKNPDVYFKHEIITVTDEYGETLDFNVLTSRDLTLETPPLDGWVVSSKDRSHSTVFSHPLLNELSLTLDCYKTESWPEINEKVFQGRINGLAKVLAKEGFNQFSVSTQEEDFTVTPPTKKLQMADGTVVEVLKRGLTKPFRVADQYAYELTARKLDSQEKVLDERLIYETVCVHPIGYTFVAQLSGSTERVGAIKPWLNHFLLHSQENESALELRQ